MPMRDMELDKSELKSIAAEPSKVMPSVQPAAITPAGYQPEMPFTPVQPAQVYPAGMEQASQTMPSMSYQQTEQRTITDPAIKSAITGLAAKQAEAIKSQYEADIQTNEIRSQAYAVAAEEIQQKKSEYEASVNELKGRQVVDPQSKWGTLNKIGAAIAMGLGAYAAAYTGGKNYAVEIIDNAITRDIALQEQEIKKLGANVDEKKNALAFAYRKFGDIDQAKSAVQMAALINAKEDIMNTAKSVDNAQAVARKKTLINAMDAKILELQAQTQDKTIITTTSNVSEKPRVIPTKLTPAEQNEALQYEEAKKSVLASFDNMSNLSRTERGVPQLVGGKRESFKAAQSSVGAVLAEKLKQRSDADWNNIMLPMLPSVMDDAETLAFKRKQLETTLKGYAPAGWIKYSGESLEQKPNVSNLKSKYEYKAQ